MTEHELVRAPLPVSPLAPALPAPIPRLLPLPLALRLVWVWYGVCWGGGAGGSVRGSWPLWSPVVALGRALRPASPLAPALPASIPRLLPCPLALRLAWG